MLEENGITVQRWRRWICIKKCYRPEFWRKWSFSFHVDNFLLSHVAAINDGAYGLFPVFCKYGVIEYCSATGHDDTGIYVGQSDSVAMQYNEAHGNVNGLEVENCTDVAVFKNHSYDNVAGLLVILLPGLND